MDDTGPDRAPRSPHRGHLDELWTRPTIARGGQGGDRAYGRTRSGRARRMSPGQPPRSPSSPSKVRWRAPVRRGRSVGRGARRLPVCWDRYPEALRLFVHGATFPTASRVAAVVGTWLTGVNQGG